MGHQRLGKLSAYRLLPEIVRYFVTGGTPTADLVDQVTEVGRDALKLALKRPSVHRSLVVASTHPAGSRIGRFSPGDAGPRSAGGRISLTWLSTAEQKPATGQRDIRTLLVSGAMAVLQAVERFGTPNNGWLTRMRAGKPRMVVAIALANKMARGLWAMLRIPTHSVGCSDSIRSVIPEYPVT